MDAPIIVCGVAIIAGLVCGRYLTSTFLVILTVIYVTVTLYSFATAREIEVMIALIYAILGGIGVLAAWITYYTSTGQTWIQDFMRKYVLRR